VLAEASIFIGNKMVLDPVVYFTDISLCLFLAWCSFPRVVSRHIANQTAGQLKLQQILSGHCKLLLALYSRWCEVLFV